MGPKLSWLSATFAGAIGGAIICAVGIIATFYNLGLIAEFQTLIAGILAIFAAAIAYVGAVHAARVQAQAALNAANRQIEAINSKERQDILWRRLAFVRSLLASVTLVSGELARRVRFAGFFLLTYKEDGAKPDESDYEAMNFRADDFPMDVGKIMKEDWTAMSLLAPELQSDLQRLNILIEDTNQRLAKYLAERHSHREHEQFWSVLVAKYEEARDSASSMVQRISYFIAALDAESSALKTE